MPEDLATAWGSRDAASFEQHTLDRGRDAALGRVAEMVADLVQPGGVVVDVGCGVGLLATHLETTSASLVGLDFSVPLLERACQRLPVCRADLFALPLRPRSADLLCCLFVLDDYDSPTKKRAMAGLVRCLRAGGTLIVAGYAPDDDRMGPRRAEFSKMGHNVYLEPESFYRSSLEALGDPRTVRLEQIRLSANADLSAAYLHRHFLIGSVQHRG